ncbi:MAG: hypothetical protein ABI151_13560 [Chitinophagaceae bacterium]
MDIVPSAPVTSSTGAINLAEVKAAENFSWSTTKKVEFTFEGNAMQEYTLLMQVLDADGNVLIQKMQKSNSRYNATLNIDINQSTITINYGADSKTIDCSAGIATMNLD